MFCTTCGTVNPDDGRFCLKCRTVLPALGAPATTPPPRSMAAPIKTTGIAPASKFAGRYEVLSILGKGGMGIVYKAHDLELGEELAIKVLQAQFASDPNEVARFKREILTARKITHPNVIRIHDFGVADGEAFISMEALGGGTLADRIARGLSIEEGTRIAIGIAEGLAAAHAKDVIHRDLKPHNVLFDDAGIPKLVDFGIARLANATSRTVGYAGTPHYMSPEQARGAEATRLSDVYALGVVMFEIFTGALPFQSDSLVGLAMQHANEPPPPPRGRRADLPPAIEAVILRALEKDPAYRFQSAKEIADALRSPQIPIIEWAPLPPPQPYTPPPSFATPPPYSPPSVVAPGRKPRRTSAFVILIATVLVASPCAGLWFLAGIGSMVPSPTPITAVTPSAGFAIAGVQRHEVGECTYLPPSGWTYAEHELEDEFDEMWRAPGEDRFVAVSWYESATLDDLYEEISTILVDEQLAVEKITRASPRITAEVRSADGAVRGFLIGDARSSGGILVAGIGRDAALAREIAERVTGTIRCN